MVVILTEVKLDIQLYGGKLIYIIHNHILMDYYIFYLTHPPVQTRDATINRLILPIINSIIENNRFILH